MKKEIVIAVALLTLGFVGCKPDDKPVTPTIQEVNVVEINISHMFGDEELILGNEYTLPSNETVTFKRLSYLLSDFYLVKSDNTKVRIDDSYAFMSVRDGLNSITLSGIAMGDYTSIGFSLGIDSAINHGNPNQYAADHPLAPINNSLHWSWKNGYIFTAIEGKSIDMDESFLFHLAGYKNKLDYNIPIPFTKKEAALRATLQHNLSEVFAQPVVYSLADDGLSTHSTTDPVTAKLFGNMNDIFSISEIVEF